MEDGARGQQGQKLYPGSKKQGQEPRVRAAAVDGPPDPLRPTGPITMPLLFPGHGAWATWPALVTFQATAEESSGQVVSPSENDTREGSATQSSPNLSLGRNPCSVWGLALLPSAGGHQEAAPRTSR